MPPAPTQRLRAIATSCAADLPAAGPGTHTWTADGLRGALGKAHANLAAARIFAAVAVTLATQLCDEAEAELTRAFAALTDSFAPVRALSEKAAFAFAQGLDDPGRSVLLLPDMATLRKAWKDMLLSLVPAAPGDNIDHLLESARWMQAVDTTIAAKPKPDGQEQQDQVLETTTSLRGPLEGLDIGSDATPEGRVVPTAPGSIALP